MATVWETLDHYHQLRQRYGRKRPRAIAKEKQQRDEANVANFLRWCEGQQLPPMLFMEKRFEAMYRASRKRAIPRTSQLVSERLAQCWQRVEDTHYQDRHAERVQKAQQPTSQIHVRELLADPLAYQEDVKRQNAQTPDGCIAMQQYSGGFHPKSPWCLQCSAATQCASQLHREHGFDVVALRLHRYHDVPNHILRAAFA